MTATTGSGKLHSLTSLRFIAAGLIVILHIRGLFGISPDIGDPILFGQGVSFFFILSGFILVYVYPKVSREGSGRFWLSRVGRIWPAHVAALLLLLLLLPLTRPTAESGASTLLPNLFLIHAWIPVEQQYYSYNSVSWSLSTELAFYLCFPLLLIGWRKTWHWKLLGSLLLVVVMIVLGNNGYFPASPPNDQGFSTIGPLQVHPFARLFEFTLGMSAALAWAALVTRRLNARLGTLCEILAIALVLVLMFSTESWAAAAAQQTWVGDAGWTWLRAGGIPALGFAFLITVLALQQGLISRALSFPLFILLGEISYSVYLIHQILVRYYLGHERSFAVIPPIVALFLFIAIVLLMSYAMWSLVEKPFRALITGLWPAVSASSDGRRGSLRNWRDRVRMGPVMSRPLAAALIALLALIVPVAYLTTFRASIDQVTPAYAEELALDVPKKFRDIDFGSAFVLVGAELRPTTTGAELELVWKSVKSQRLDYSVAVHVVSEDGAILSGLDYPQDPATPWIAEGALWRDIVELPADNLAGGSAVAIGLYRLPEGLLRVARGPRDWDDHRLLIPLDLKSSGTKA